MRLLWAIRTELRQEEEQVRGTDLAVFVNICWAWVGEVERTRPVFHGRRSVIIRSIRVRAAVAVVRARAVVKERSTVEVACARIHTAEGR